MIRGPKGIVRERTEIGVSITPEKPSREMELEAITAGVYTSPIDGRDYTRIQILSIAELLEKGTQPMLIRSPYQQGESIADKKVPEQQEVLG